MNEYSLAKVQYFYLSINENNDDDVLLICS